MKASKYSIYRRRTWTAEPFGCVHQHRTPFRAYRCSVRKDSISTALIMASDDGGKRWRQLGFEEVQAMEAGIRREQVIRLSLHTSRRSAARNRYA